MYIFPGSVFEVNKQVFFLTDSLILEKEEGREREKDINLLFYLFMHSLVDSCTCLDGDRTRNLGISG